MESPTLIVMALFVFVYGTKECCQSQANQFLILLFTIHYCNRALIYPFRMSQGAPMPIGVFLIAWLYVIWNSFTQAIALTRVNIYPSEHLSRPSDLFPFLTFFRSDWLSNLRFIFGTILFFFGFFANIHADNTLLALKAQKDKKCDKGETGGYQIPHGGLFNYVSCANYSKLTVPFCPSPH